MVYAEADNVVPPTVILVIAVLQEASSVKVTLKGASTVADAAAVNVGELEPEETVVPETMKFLHLTVCELVRVFPDPLKMYSLKYIDCPLDTLIDNEEKLVVVEVDDNENEDPIILGLEKLAFNEYCKVAVAV